MRPAGGIHHVCLEVADVRQSLQALTPAGVRVLDPEPKIGAHGNPVRGCCWLDTMAGTSCSAHCPAVL